MSIRQILHYPDPRLRRQANPVPQVNDDMRRLLDDMAETMYQAPGIGLAATQIDEPWRIIVIDISSTRDQLQVFINPEILSREGELELEEGCLSVPGIYEPVTRAQSVHVRAQNREGQEFEIQANDLLATCIQHEIDHLDGKVFVDYLSRLKQTRIRKKLGKRGREQGAESSRSEHATGRESTLAVAGRTRLKI
jgi:peptide deformylase